MVLFLVSGPYSIRSHNFFLSNSVNNVNCFNTHQRVCFHALVKVVFKKNYDHIESSRPMKLILKLKRQSYFSICVKLFFSIKHHIFYFIFFRNEVRQHIIAIYAINRMIWTFADLKISLWKKSIYMCRDSTIKFYSYIFNTNYIIKQ